MQKFEQKKININKMGSIFPSITNKLLITLKKYIKRMWGKTNLRCPTRKKWGDILWIYEIELFNNEFNLYLTMKKWMTIKIYNKCRGVSYAVGHSFVPNFTYNSINSNL